MSSTAQVDTGEEHTELRRVMGPKLLLLFIVGDILGTGVYALTGKVASEVGGAAWAPFLVAFAIAMITAFSYLELVTKYPQAAGAALYTHKAFGVHFLTFIVAFTVMCSGITSASTASRAFASNLAKGFGLDSDNTSLVMVLALAFMAVVALVNLRGVGESVKANIVLTLVELSGLLLVIMVGFFALTAGETDFSRTMVFESPNDKSAFLAVTAATALAFFAMVGFEDSVNMAEETHDPVRTFPKMMITGIGITGVIYILVALFSVAIVPVGELGKSETPLVTVVETAAPSVPIDTLLPFISMFAVANSALINMLMASRLLYGMARQEVLPPVLGRVHPTRQTPWAAIAFTTALAFGLILYVSGASTSATELLGGTTSLLLLGVFTVVNICVLVLRKDVKDRPHFVAPTALPALGALLCAFFVTPLTGRDSAQYEIAGWLLLIGVVLWAITWFANRALRSKKTYIRHPEDIGEREGGVN
ncbi:amino acid/polyamine/organocation transporter, APC superfamily [Pedococcus cremeus]|uniref:Amino acid/polyamine/organocation transporter, APC superfamily n=1 Tax=Pedococcus cremeus TaxID=587636 RepID=A0A1H9T7Y7_9MICO|nr:APC family permease [Pedococcus cremeus]SER92723.1 amino acid/polyamine/organocation transporter, APC superfamily [Pedococcus cremeus]